MIVYEFIHCFQKFVVIWVKAKKRARRKKKFQMINRRIFVLISSICQFIFEFQEPNSLDVEMSAHIRSGENLEIDYSFDDCTDCGNLSSRIPQFIRNKGQRICFNVSHLHSVCQLGKVERSESEKKDKLSSELSLRMEN